MAESLREQVRQQAQGCCEYCCLPQTFTTLPHEVDHIRPQKHRGSSLLTNLCLACAYCNWCKGSNAAGFDPHTDELTPLFNPRTDAWSNHFAWNGPVLVGKTAVGRTTIDVLRINIPERVEQRRLLVEAGVFPPT